MKQDINDILKSVRKRPGMYLAEFSVYELATFVCGYECAMHSNFDQSDKDISFMNWVEYKYHISNPAWHWSRILHHEAGSEQDAMLLFFKIWPDYWQEKSSFTPPSNAKSFSPPEKSVTDIIFEERMRKPWLRLV